MTAFQSDHNRRLYNDVVSGVEACKATCEYFGVCKGGFPSNKHSEKGSFAVTETEYCRRYFMMRADAYLDRLEELQEAA